MGFFNRDKNNKKEVKIPNFFTSRLEYLKVKVPPINIEDEEQKRHREKQIDILISSMPIIREYDTFEEDLEDVLYSKGYDQYEGEEDEEMHLLTLLPLEIEILRKIDMEMKNGNIVGSNKCYLQEHPNHVVGKIKAEVLKIQMRNQTDRIEMPNINQVIEEMEEQRNS